MNKKTVKIIVVMAVTGALFALAMNHLLAEAFRFGTLSIPSVAWTLVAGLLFAGSMSCLLDRWEMLDGAAAG